MARLLQDSPSLPWRIIRHVTVSLRLQSDSLRLTLILTCCPVKLGTDPESVCKFPREEQLWKSCRSQDFTVHSLFIRSPWWLEHDAWRFPEKKNLLSFKTHAALNMMKPLMVMLYLTWYTAHSFVPCIYGVQAAAP